MYVLPLGKVSVPVELQPASSTTTSSAAAVIFILPVYAESSCGLVEVWRCEQAPVSYLGTGLLRRSSLFSASIYAYQRRIAFSFLVILPFSAGVSLGRFMMLV